MYYLTLLGKAPYFLKTKGKTLPKLVLQILFDQLALTLLKTNDFELNTDVNKKNINRKKNKSLVKFISEAKNKKYT